MIVVDTNVIAYLYLEGEHSRYAEIVLKNDPVWAAPLLWRSEFRNILTLYLRKKILSYTNLLQICKQAESLMAGMEYSVSSEKILDLTYQSNCSAYDCEFVALAKELNAPLITADKKILADFPEYCVALNKFVVTN